MTTLTKTKYRSGLQCIKKLWHDGNKSLEPTPPSLSDQLRFERGREVEGLARQTFDDSILIETFNPEDAATETEQAIRDGCDVIMEATFMHDQLSARVDVLQRSSDDSWNLIEIKMTSKVKKEHIPDVAFQRHVAELCGINIDRCFLMYLNKDCVYPDLSNLFTQDDITDEVVGCFPELSTNADAFVKISGNTDAPEVRIGKHCSNPYRCHYREHCWRHVPFHSIFTIPRLHEKKLETLLDSEILDVADVPADFQLTATQQKYVDLIKGGIPVIDRRHISSSLDSVEYPIYFLDFEADRPPIPRLQGMNPFGLLPFQFSLHVLDSSGNLTEHAFLHSEDSDCRQSIAAALDEYIGDSGSVVVFNKTFEKGVLESLATFVKERQEKLLSIRDRLWDQYDIFKDSYMHPGFGGSNSLKDVLEVLVPALSYADLDVGSGDAAIAAWVRMIKTEDQTEKEALRMGLEKYCNLDTLAMVEIHKHLVEIAKAN